MADGTQVYTVEYNGKVFDVEGPAGATPDQLQAFVQANGGAPAEDATAPTAAQPTVGAPAPAQAPQSSQQAPAVPGAAPAAQPNIQADELEGGFADTQPAQVAAKFAPEVEGQYAALLRTGTLDQINQFLTANGRGADPVAMAKYVAARDAGKPVRATVSYARPKAQTDTAGAAVRGALDTVTMGALPKIGAAVGAVTAGLQGRDMGGAYNRTLDENNAVVAADEEDHGWARTAGQLAGGLVLPAGIEGVGVRAGTAALRAGRTLPEARAIAARALTQRLATVSAGYGAAHGALSADNLPDAVTGALSEAAAGAVGGAVLGRAAQVVGARKLAGRAATEASERMAVARAADRQGIDVIRADVSGPGIRNLSEGIIKTPYGAQPLVAAAEKTLTQLEAARDRVASDVGKVFSPQGLGDTVIEGARKYRKAAKLNASQLYDQADELADGIIINPTNAKDEVYAQIAELENTPGGSDILPYLRKLADDFESRKNFSVADIRRMRTTMRQQFIKDGVDRSDAERRVGLVMDEAKIDIRNDLRYQGAGDAYVAYEAADKAYRGYKDIAENVLAPLIGSRTEPKSGYAIAKALTSDLSANAGRAARLIKTLPDEERANVQASIIGALGSGGKQQDKAFSVDLFLKHWGDVDKSAKNAFFGPEARAALDDLSTISRGVQKTKAFANRSNTGGVLGVGQAVTTGAAVLTGGVSIPAALATAGGQYGLARWLASPKFARALVRLPVDASKKEAVFLDRIARIARAEPALATDMGLIARALKGQQATAAPDVTGAAPEQDYQTDEEALAEAQAQYEAEQVTANQPVTTYPDDEDNYAGGYPAQED